MSRVAIVTDSNSGITQETASEMGIRVLPMPFTIDGKEYFEDISLTQEEFYEKLKGNADPECGYCNFTAFAGIRSGALE